MSETMENDTGDQIPDILLPQKRFYRQRAHCNPRSDHSVEYPTTPDDMNWEKLYPKLCDGFVRFLDIGCGYGGFTLELAKNYPHTLCLGLEIRVKVSDYVNDRIKGLRIQNEKSDANYQNVAILRSNAMKHLSRFFHKHQLTKMFFMYPDPHFKKAKHKWRIISKTLLAEYAYFLAPSHCKCANGPGESNFSGGRIYTITDVKDLHEWMVGELDDFPLFKRLPEDELCDDPIMKLLPETSEEGKKVSRNKGNKFIAVYQRISDNSISCSASNSCCT